jgi:hypothetical protein
MVNESKSIPLKSLELKGTILNSTAKFEYKQVFENDTSSPIECVYKFPTDRYFAVTGLRMKSADKEINAVIMEKEEAKNKYDDAVAAGDTAVKMNFDEKLPDIIELNVGQIQANSTVEITVSIVSELEVVIPGHYTFVFPLEFVPRYGDFEGIAGQFGNVMPAPFSMEMKVQSTSALLSTRLSHDEFRCSTESESEVVIHLDAVKGLNAKDIVIAFTSEGIRKPQVSLAKSDKFPNEIAAHVSFIPRSSEEIDILGKYF